MFTIGGSYRGRLFDLTWDAGKLSGDEDIITLLKIAAKYETVSAPGGPYWSGDEILKSDFATFHLAYAEFDDVHLVIGEVSPIPEVPEGAIP